MGKSDQRPFWLGHNLFRKQRQKSSSPREPDEIVSPENLVSATAHQLKIPLTIFIQYNYALVLEVTGKSLPSSDAIKNLRAGTPREAEAKVRALLSGTACIHRAKQLSRTDKGSQSQNQLGCLPHICCGFAQQSLSSLSTLKAWQGQNYKTAIPFLASETSIIY